MDRLRIIYHRYNMRVIALLLAVVTFFNVPLTSYASVSTPSDIDSDFMISGEYMPDNIISRYEESFDYCPDMPPNPYARIALADDVVIVIVALLAACGIYVGSNSDLVHQIASGFDTYIRRTAGNVKSVMTAWAAVLSAEAGKTIEGIKVLLPYLRDYLKFFFKGYGTGKLEYSYNAGTGTLKNGPYSVAMVDFLAKNNYSYIMSFMSGSNKNQIFDFALSSNIDIIPVAAFSVSGYVALAGFDSDGKYVTTRKWAMSTRTYDTVNLGYVYSEVSFSENFKYFPTQYSTDEYKQQVGGSCSLPVFMSEDFARSYVKYGTLDGMLVGTPDTTVNVSNAWTQLQQDAFDRFGNTLTLPSTPEEWAAIQNQLASAATADDALKALSNVMDITSGGGILPPPITGAVAYDNLSYVVKTLAGYCGAVLTQGQIDDFISSFYSSNVDGTSALVEEQSNSIVRNFVVINGGSTDPDDDERNNTYKVLKKLAVSLGTFLIGLGLVSDSPNFDGNPTISNVQVVEDLPSPAPNPNPNPDTGVDLSGVLNFLQSILNVLNTWANPLALMDSLISKLGLPTISDGIKAAINTLPKLISGELTLPELFGNVVDAIFALPQQVANAIDKALGLEKALEGLGLNKLFDNVIELLPDVLVEGFALSSLFSGLSAVVGAVPKAIAELFGLANGFSLSNVLNGLSEKIVALPEAFANKFKPSETTDSDKEDGGDSGLRKFMNALLMLAFILVILLIFFLNCLRFIVLLFAIPANTDLFNEEVLSGLNFLKETQLPLFNLSIYHLLMGAVYFVLFMSIIATLRRKINHIRIE